MKQKTTKIKIKLPDHVETEMRFKEDLKGYQIKYNAFTDIWEIRNRKVKHSLWYNPLKESKLKTKNVQPYKEVTIVNIILFLIFGGFYFLNKKYNWTEDISFLYLWIVLTFVVDFLILKWKPKYQIDFLEEHDSILQYISQFRIE